MRNGVNAVKLNDELGHGICTSVKPQSDPQEGLVANHCSAEGNLRIMVGRVAECGGGD